ncbi:MAG TPA: succinate dehydrogenase [Myxococcales bacterium]|jgi:succinate dehydrogenase / fumarate reductase cytochrome b subunit|nr:succinate dehydrogenase [Myxococcales bacterium]
MSQPAESTAAAPRGTSASFVWTRLGSVLAILPLGVWTVNHLWDNLSAFSGKGAWELAVEAHPHPVAHALTLLMVLLPLVLHTAWGLGRLTSGRANVTRYRTYGNLKWVLQRLSAVGVLGFLGAHLWLAMIKPRLFEGGPEPFQDIAREMRFHGPTLLVYLLGTLGVAFHLGNGITSFAWTWGLAAGRKSLARVDRLALLTFAVLLAFSWAAIYALYEAGGAYGP